MHPLPTGVPPSTVSLVWSHPERKDVGSAHRWSMTQPHGGRERGASVITQSSGATFVPRATHPPSNWNFPLLSPSLEGTAHFLYLKSCSNKASASRWHSGAMCHHVPSPPPQASQTCLLGSRLGTSIGPSQLPWNQHCLPVWFPDYWLCCCYSLNW